MSWVFARLATMTISTERSARLSTIRGLLEKAESTPFPEEAEAFLAKATELMSRHAISEALVWADGSSADAPTEIRLVLDRPFIPQKAVLVSAVAESLRCQSIRLGDAVDGRQIVAVIGFGRDLELVETLVTSLLVQLATSLARLCPRTGSPHETASWRRSFIAGFTDSVHQRLAADRARATEDAAAARAGPAAGARSVDLVLADRDGSVDEELRRRHPYIRISKVSIGSSTRGRQAGRAEGRRADLGRRRIPSQPSLGR